MSIEYILIGLLVGLLVGMTGVGGASLLTPILVLMGVQPTIAIGTDFAYNSITKIAGAAQHIRQRTVNFQLVKYLAIGSLPSGFIAIILFYYFLSNYYQDDFILLLLGWVQIIVSVLSLVQMSLKCNPLNRLKNKPLEEKRHIIIICGVIIGAIVGITSVGAGSLFTLFMLHVYNLETSELVGTDITHAFFLTFISGLLMASFGHINYILVGNLLCGSIPGAIIGSKLTIKINPTYMRLIIILVILISGIKLVL